MTIHGSSPRMWGTRHAGIKVVPVVRFIPTHVGNTPPLPSRASGTPVHPHACGEHPLQINTSAQDAGSSPRMWGTPPSPSRKRSHERFIPTHVGNTSRHGRGARRTPVHPHACGEHRTGSPCLSRSSGSSPRMWGTRNFRETVNEHPRFIPTHVGNTPAGAPPPRCASVHPHACGEHDGEIRGRNGSLGSSPRMWGTQMTIKRFFHI